MYRYTSFFLPVLCCAALHATSVHAAEYFVDSDKGMDTATGMANAPVKSLKPILAKVKPGDTVNLKGIFLGYTDLRGIKGAAGAPITFQSTGAPAVFDGGRREFREVNTKQWERVPAAEHPAPDEWRSTMEIPDSGYRGQFLDTKYRLLTYSTWGDFRSTNETWAYITDPADPRPSVQMTNGKGVLAKTRAPWCYYGPGVKFNSETKRLHIRLSPTHHGVTGPGVAEYTGETDPNKLRLAVTAYDDTTFGVEACQYLTFRNIDIQNGGNWLGPVNGNTDITFDHCHFYPGTYPLRFGQTNKRIFLTNCLHDGGMPPWSFRSEFKDVYNYLTPDGQLSENDQVRKTQRTLLSFEAADSEISYNEFRHGHDVYFSGARSKFDHNLVENIHDDSMYLIANPNVDMDVFQNYFHHCLTVFSFGAGDSGNKRRFYRNVVDVREPVVSFRPDGKQGHDAFRTGAIFKNTQGTYTFYQNTFVTLAEDMRDSFSLYSVIDKVHPRMSFNNIFVSLNPKITLSFLDRPDQPVQDDGNLWYRAGKSDAPLFRYWPYGDQKRGGTFATLKDYQASPLFEATKANYPPGAEASSIVADPKFMSFSEEKVMPGDDLRLAADSPARGAGIVLPADLPDPLRPKDGSKPDIGAFPYGAEPLKVGIDGRYTVPDLAAKAAVKKP